MSTSASRSASHVIRSLKSRGAHGGSGTASAATMHRQRKKDLNVKPNRQLDKKSSRGMLFENEELRLRTIHINDEVDRSHNDIKKLKKENEHLKHEIWGLRDEYEKLEDMLKKVCIVGGMTGPEFNLEEILNITAGVDDDDNYSEFDMDEDCVSVIEQNISGAEDCDNKGDHQNNNEISNSVDEGLDSCDASAAQVNTLEVVQEESETSSTSPTELNSAPRVPYVTKEISDPDQVNTNVTFHPSTSQANSTPIIEVTCAENLCKNEPINTTVSNVHAFDSSLPVSHRLVTDAGCITSIPETFKAIQNVQVSPNFPLNDEFYRDRSGTLRWPEYGRYSYCCCRKNCSGAFSHANSCHSEPASLNAMGMMYTLNKIDSLPGPGTKGVDDSPWNKVDGNILIGKYSGEALPNLMTQEILDRLQPQELTSIIGIRLVPSTHKIFILLQSKSIVHEFLQEAEQRELIVRDAPVTITKGDEDFTEMILVGCPSGLPDWTVTSVLNQWGQVVAPLQAKKYKGVDISERVVHIHLTTLVPNNATLVIQGYHVVANITKLQNDINPVSTPLTPQYPTVKIEEVALKKSREDQKGNTNFHKPVGRSCSSAPRLESENSNQPSSTMGPGHQIFQKRQMSVNGSANYDKNNMPNPPVPQKPGANQAGASSGGNFGKKSFMRNRKLSEGEALGNNNPASCVTKQPALSRGLTLRKNSSSSQLSGITHLGFSRFLSSDNDLNGHHRSGTVKSEKRKIKQYAGKDEALPWCGCWGNGLI